MNHAVTVTDLVKRYHPQAPPVVDGLSFTVVKGEVFGLLGPNGAGKSTTVGVLTTRILPTSGRCLVLGTDVVAHPGAAKRLLAVVPQRQNLDRSPDVRQNLLFHCPADRCPGAAPRAAGRRSSRHQGVHVPRDRLRSLATQQCCSI
ncbi:ATP-binding cassette domain-containing protein [Kitasatospora sp. NPDC018058]|uniref:ATP-binding cassette domain-containing protein n=1 Tax=Kitasatospora sp. NPDC018058 TaxID=3364025 RepID=UPI0037BE9BA8